jgi:hypothetical protein
LSVKEVGFFRKETDEAGRASFDLPGKFTATLVVVAEMYRPRAVTLHRRRASQDGKRTIPLEDTSNDRRISFRVLDHFSSAPIPHAAIEICDGTLTAWDKTDGFGVLAVPRDFYATPIALKITAEKYHPARRMIRNPEEEKGGSIELFPDDPVTVVLMSPQGERIPGGRIRFQSGGDGWRGRRIERTADERGEAVFFEIASGPGSGFHVAALCPGYLPVSRRWSLLEVVENRNEIAVTLKAGMGIHGFLMGQDIFGEEGAVLEIYALEAGEGGGGLKTVSVSPGGTFFLDGVQAGEARARIRKGGTVFFLGNVRIEENALLEIALPEPMRIQLRVFGPDRNPLPGAKVFLCRRDVGFPMKRFEGEADATGTCTVFSCAPGKFDGAVTAPGHREKGFKFEIPGDRREQTLEIHLERE